MPGSYVLFGEVAAGGMGTVHLGRLVGAAGFSRTVAIKRLHPHLANDPEFATMFLDEARLASRIHHPNVAATLDVVVEGSRVLLVMEYVHGEALSRLMSSAHERGEQIPLPIVSAIVTQALYGLHAAHDAKDESGAPLHIVHRDVSPQNVLVGADGVARVVDFGIAKAAHRSQTTRDGALRGKVAYMSPEQVRGEPLDRRSDVFTASIVLWEMLCGKRLFTGETPTKIMADVLGSEIPSPSQMVPTLPGALDGVVLNGLARDREARFASAHELAVALEEAVRPATTREVAQWITSRAKAALDARAKLVEAMERESSVGIRGPDETTAADARSPDPAAKAEEPTHSTLSRSVDASPRRSAKAVMLGAVIGVVAALLVLGYVGIRRWRLHSVPPPEPAAARALSAPEPATASATAIAASPTRDAGEPIADVPPASSAQKRQKPAPAKKTAPKPTATVDCSNPFITLPDGVRRFREECVR